MDDRPDSNVTGKRLAAFVSELRRYNEGHANLTVAECDAILGGLARGDDPRDISNIISSARHAKQQANNAKARAKREEEQRLQDEKNLARFAEMDIRGLNGFWLNSMNPNPRFPKLGITLPTTPEVVHAVFRVRSKDCHPDVGGNPDEFRILVAERDLALRFCQE
jgi:hypothetical protein